ncbi:S41 family peptidase [Acidobacteriota bacterium]
MRVLTLAVVILAICGLIVGLTDKVHASNWAMTFARSPVPSPDGTQLVLSYAGDLWILPLAGPHSKKNEDTLVIDNGLRLTAHPAYESSAVWSPDGRTVIFSSDRHGNRDVFAVSLDGGTPSRLTHFSRHDDVEAVTPGGESIYFSSHRTPQAFLGTMIYRVPVEGGPPRPVFMASGSQAAPSPDGRYLCFVRGGVAWWRKDYRGAANTGLWLYDLREKTFRLLMDTEANENSPSFLDEDTVIFRSDADGTYNIYAISVSNGARRKLTHYTGDDVRRPSAGGGVIAYAHWDSVYVLLPGDVTPRRLVISMPVDVHEHPAETLTLSAKATEYALHPMGKECIVAVRGELFAFPVHAEKDLGDPLYFTTRLTRTSQRESTIAYGPEGKTVAFASDREGSNDLYLLSLSESEGKGFASPVEPVLKRLTSDDTEEHSPNLSPDGKRIAYVRGKGDLMVMNSNGSDPVLVSAGFSLNSFSWSPDSRWLAFARFDDNFNSDIYIVDIGGEEPGEPVNISLHPDNDYYPLWAENGRTLFFQSRRRNNEMDIWMVLLRKDDEGKTDQELEEAWKAPEATVDKAPKKEKKKKKKSKQEDKPAEPVVKVRIDFDEIHKRVRRVTSLSGDEGQFSLSRDGLTVAFFGRSEKEDDVALYTVQWNGKKLKHLISAGKEPQQIVWNSNMSRIFYLDKGGKVQSVDVKGKKKKTHGFSAKMRIDLQAEREQVFAEGHRVLRERFYDPDFVGVDWDAMLPKYFSLAQTALTEQDFLDAFRMMLGELNSSHSQIYGKRGEGGESTGFLGIDLDADHEGPGLKVASVLKNSPADLSDSRIVPGEIILSINGVEVSPSANIHALMTETAGQRIRLEVRPKEGKVRHVYITPIPYSPYTRLKYDAWVEDRRRRVDELSNGRLGYIHIYSMSWTSFERFETELFTVAHDKEGLVIDVRNNGGGWITDRLLTVLTAPDHAWTRARDAGVGYPQHRRVYWSWNKPAATLCNEYSFSNAEIFSHAFKMLERGKLIGQTTFGGVISTGSQTLIDGTRVRVPMRGWWAIPTDLNMELNGTVPDIIVEVTPKDQHEDRDPQLEKAVSVLLEEIGP